MSSKSWLSSLVSSGNRKALRNQRNRNRKTFKSVCLNFERLEERMVLATLGIHALLEGPTSSSASVVVTTAGAYLATENETWLDVPSPGGTGNGTEVFTLDANTGPTRVGTLTIAGETLTVTQAGSNYEAANMMYHLASAGQRGPDVVVDGSGNVYFTDYDSNTLNKWNASTQTVSTLASGLVRPAAVAVDGAGNVFFIDSSNGAVEPSTINKWDATTQVVTTVTYASPSYSGSGLEVDGDGNVYIAEHVYYHNSARVLKWNAATNTTNIVFSLPDGRIVGGNGGIEVTGDVAVDAAGNVYLASFDTIFKWDAATQTYSPLITGLTETYGVAVDGSGNVYFDNGSYNPDYPTPYGTPEIQKWHAATQTVSTIFTNPANTQPLSVPQGVAVDSAGNIYISDTNTSGIYKLPHAFVPITPLNVFAQAGSASLGLPVLSTTQDLTGIFAPTSDDESWLTIGSVEGNVIHFSFTENTTGAPRTANISVLGKTIAVTQSNTLSNVAPTIAVNAPASVTVNEGSLASISGTWSDANLGDTVTLSASIGTVTPSGTNDAGAWTWSYTPTLYAPGQTVTITADDGTVSTQTTFTLTVADAPLTAVSFTPPTATEREPFGPTTVFKFTDANPAGAATDYVATVETGDGNTFTNTAHPDLVQIVADGSGGFDVKLSYTYADELSGATFRVQVSGAGGASTSASTANLFSGAITTLASLPPGGIYVPNPSSLVMDAAGNLFGTTVNGGDFNHGSVFKVAAGSGAVTILASFDGTNGSKPLGVPVIDSQGSLYGTTAEGGAFEYDNGGLGYGTVWKLAAGASTITTLVSFDSSNGAYPQSALVIDGSDRLFGNTVGGGPQNYGTVFEVDADSGDLTTLAFLNGTDGGGPRGRLVMDGSGNLFGTTEFFGQGPGLGYGTVFQVPRLGGGGYGALTTLVYFDGSDPANPINPKTSLAMDGSGNLFGTTFEGGAFGMGAVYKVAAGSGVVTTVASLSANSEAGLVMDGNGNLFGATFNGGEFGFGSVYVVAQDSGILTTLASFDYSNTGAQPARDLFMDASGVLYSTALGGGEFGVGTVYKVELTPEMFSVAGALNAPPTIAVDVAAVSANEGSSAANTGTFSDPDGNSTVAITASVGTVTQDNANGTWSWSLPVADDTSAPVTVTITADDGVAATVTTTFTYAVDNKAPTATFGSNGTVTYGQTLTVSFSGQHDDSSADTTAGFRYAYSQTGDFTGITFASGSSTTATRDYAGLSAGNHTFYARIIDKDGGFSDYSTTLTVSPAPLTVTVDNKSKTYGQSDPALTYIYTGLVNNETTANFSGSLSRALGNNVGTYLITQNNLAATGNYTIGTFNNGTLTINPKSLTVTADNKSKTYGQSDPALKFTYNGLVNNENVASFTGALSRAAGNNVGTYLITQNNLAATGNYTIGTFNNGTLTINPLPNKITFGSLNPVVYGAVPITLGATASSGLPVSYTVVSGPGSIGAVFLANQSFETSNQGWVFNGLAGIAANGSVLKPPPAPHGSKAAFVQSSGFNNHGTITQTVSLPAAGRYTVQFSAAGQDSTSSIANPFRVLIDGIAVGPTIRPTLGVYRTYSVSFDIATPGDHTLRFVGLGDGEGHNVISFIDNVSYRNPNGNVLTITGAGTIVIQASQAATGNYGTAASVTQSLTVHEAPLAVTAVNANKIYGQPDPALIYTYTGLVNNETKANFTGGLSRTTGENAGTYDITNNTLDATGNYTIGSFTKATFTITPASQTITFGKLAKVLQSAPPITLSASASSGLPVSYSVVSGPGAISGNVLTIDGGGTIQIQAAQAGNGNYSAAVPVTQSLIVTATTGGIVKAGGLQFMITTLGSNFTKSGTMHTFNTTDNTDVQVGYEPAAGTAFKPLMTLEGLVTIDTNAKKFWSTGQVSTVASGAVTPVLSSIPSTGIDIVTLLTDAGVSGLNSLALGFKPGSLGTSFKLSSLAFSSTAGLKLRGSIEPLTGLIVPIAGTNSLNISNAGVISLTGVNAAPQGSLTVSGVKFNASQLKVNYTPANEFKLYGNASITATGIGGLTVNLGQSTSPGLVITNGAVTSFSATTVGAFKVGGVLFAAPPPGLSFIWNNSTSTFSVAGTASATVSNMNNINIDLGIVANPGLVITNGSLTKLRAIVTGTLTVGGVSLTTTGSTNGIPNGPVVFEYKGSRFTITGNAALNINNVGAMNITFGNESTPGVDIDSEGKLTQLTLTINGKFTVSSLSFTANKLKFEWRSANSTFSLSGTASFALKVKGFTNNMNVTFGYEGRPGLIIESGSLKKLDLILDSQLKVNTWVFSTTGLNFTWEAAGYGTNTGNSAVFTIVGGKIAAKNTAAIKGNGLDELTVRFGSETRDANGNIIARHPGLVITGGSLDILDMTIDSTFYVYYGVIQIDVGNLQFKWEDAGKGSNTSDEAIFSIPRGTVTGTVRYLDKLDGLVSAKSTFTFGRDVTDDYGNPIRIPGLRIKGDTLDIIDITFDRDFGFPGLNVDSRLTIRYANGILKLEGQGSASLLGVSNGNAEFHLTIDNSRNGLVERFYNGGFGDHNLNPIDPSLNPNSLLALNPLTTRKLNTALDFDGDTLRTRSGRSIGTDYFGTVWQGQVEIGAVGSGAPLVAGPITFGTRSDEGSMIFIDMNRNGVFEANELVVNNGGFHGAQNRVGTVTLAETGSYPIAIGYYEGEYADQITVRFKQGTVAEANFDTMTLLDPGSPTQFGLWSVPQGYNPFSVTFQIALDVNVAGLQLADAFLDVNYNSSTSTLVLTGEAKVDLAGVAELKVNLGGNGTQGIVIENGKLKALDFSAHAGLNLFIVKANLNAWGSFRAEIPATFAATQATNAQLNEPNNLALDSAGNLFIADTSNHQILKVSTNGVITVVKTPGLNRPADVAVDAAGNLYIADTDHHRIVKVLPNGSSIIVAGTGDLDDNLRYPTGVAVDAAGNLWIADHGHHRIRKLPANGVVSLANAGFETPDVSDTTVSYFPTGASWTFTPQTYAGIASRSYFDYFNAPQPIEGNQAAILQTGSMTQTASFPAAGRYSLRFSAAGSTPIKLSIDDVAVGTITPNVNAYGNYSIDFSIASPGNHTVKFTGLGTAVTSPSYVDSVNILIGITTVAGLDYEGGYSGDGGPATSARLAHPWDMTVDAAGNLFIAEWWNHTIRKVSTSGVITTIAGKGPGEPGYSGDGGAATSARLHQPKGVAVDAMGNLYIADSLNHVIRKVSTSGVITTIAGKGPGEYGYSGDGGAATSARLHQPHGVALNAQGTLFIADTVNNVVRRVTGVMSTVAGTGVAGRIPGSAAVPAVLDIGGSLSLDVDIGFLGLPSPIPSRLTVGSTSFALHYVIGDNSASYVVFGYRFLFVDVWLWVHFDFRVSLHLHWVKNPFDWRFGGFGPIAGANVYYDANSDFGFAGDLSALTASNGTFQLDIPGDATTGQLVLVGGTDQSTGMPNTTILTAPVNAKVISPFSTLINGIQRQTVTRERSATAMVQQALGIPAAIDPMDTDYIKQALAGDPAAARVFALDVQLAALAHQVDHLLSAAGGGTPTPEQISIAFFDALARRIAQSGGAPLDLADPATIQALIEDTARKVNVTLDPAVAAGAATIVADVNRYIKNLPVPAANLQVPAAGFLAYMNQVVQAQVVAQKTITPLLRQAGAGTLDINDVVTANTGAALEAQIAVAQVGLLNLDGPTIAIDNVVAERVGDGYAATMEFPVYLTATEPLTESISVDYTTEDGTATAANGDYTPVSGTLTWQPGESGPKFISVPISPTNVTPHTIFKVVLSNPINADIHDGDGIGDIKPYAVVATTTTLTTSAASTTADQSVTFTATVAQQNVPNNPASGSVTFHNGDIVLGTGMLENGVATFTTNLSGGSHTITALYQGERFSYVRYEPSAAALTQTITRASQTIGFAPLADQVYGASPFVLDAGASSGLPVSYRIVSGPATIEHDLVTITGVGTVVIAVTQAGDADFIPAEEVFQSFEVTPAPLTFTVFNQEMVYGTSLPVFTGAFSGFASGEGLDDFAVDIIYHTAAAGSDAGTYLLTASLDDPDNQLANYIVQVIDASLTVARAELYVGAYDTSKTYGETVTVAGSLTAGTASDVFENDGITASFTSAGVAASASVADGPYLITAALSDPNNRLGNYDIIFVDGKLTVNPATLIITADDQSRVYGDRSSTFTVSYAGFVNGDDAGDMDGVLSFTPADSTTLRPGTYTVTPGGLTSPNYITTFVSAFLTVVPMGVVDGELVIAGTDGRDIINVVRRGSVYRVDARLDGRWIDHHDDRDWDDDHNNNSHDDDSEDARENNSRFQHLKFDAANITSIRILGFDGNDQIRVGQSVHVPAFIDGGLGNDRIWGGNGSDTIIDSAGNNRIHAGKGNDTVTTGAGDDRIWTDGGNDNINAGNGNNRVHSGNGNDIIVTGSGNDYVWTDGGADTINVGDGSNEVHAGGGNNTIIAGSGDDKIWTGGGDDVINAGDGVNDIASGGGDDTITTGNGNDLIRAGAGNDRVWAGGGADSVNGGAGNDILFGGEGNDLLLGDAGRDILIGGMGADRIQGNSDDDILIAGWTLYDNRRTAIDAIMASWSSGGSYSSRVNSVATGAGVVGGYRLLGDDGTSQTVFNDNDVDVLTGNQGQDWFFANRVADNGGVLDTITDLDEKEFWRDTDF